MLIIAHDWQNVFTLQKSLHYCHLTLYFVFFFFIAKKGRPVKASKEEKVDKRRGLVVTKPKIVNSSKQGKTTGQVTAKV